jgi:hypothetical protein
VTTGSGSGASILQFASGYRAAHRLGAFVADTDAKEEGARLVYKSLQSVFPSRFPELADNQRLTAEQIAGNVLFIAGDLKRELDLLQIQVTQLQAEVTQYKAFLTNLAQTVEQLQSGAANIHDVDSLKAFQQHSNDLLARMQDGLDESQKMAIKSVQGLVNTFVQVGVNIAVNIQAQVKANVQKGLFNK